MDILGEVYKVVLAVWGILLESSPYVLLGFFVAGLLKAFLPKDFVSTHLGGNGIKSIVKASAMGVPIPLCSCGVVPAAAGLKEQGAGKGAVTSFLISTPETGVDSIAVTYALLDPVMTIIRPVSAFVTAIAAGISVSFSSKFEDDEQKPQSPFPMAQDTGGCTDSCCGGHAQADDNSFKGKFKSGMNFAFGELLNDIGKWFIIGIILAGLISVFLSPEIVSKYFGNEYLSMIIMLAIAIPLYVCATASTPIAAALALKGISPGAALVFLMAGPATNVASLTVVSKIIGKKATAIYLFVIIVISFVLGIAVNYLYGYLGISISSWVQGIHHEEFGIIAIGSSILLLLLIGRTFLPSKHAH
ncbi:MAG: SO_0444 family Cu/Zn efflux transporter [Desulfobacterales bacterium]|nr:SO_0444 family Cu/Zn efflux transporter [Desulfobacterales bacterium]MCP4161367.1 SO_0444 family Cu/Zn efflux transporter [Deltaproteobacteria bacterium]